MVLPRCSPIGWIAPALLVFLSFSEQSLDCFGQEQRLKVDFGARGVEKVVYHGTVLEDVSKFSGDIFHIWHLKMTDLKGSPVNTGQYGWGENASGKVWDVATHSWTYTFSWGSICAHFIPGADTLGVEITETNKAGSGVTLDGAAIYPFGMHFPKLPKAFNNPAYPQLNDGVSAPSILLADYGDDLLAIVGEDSSGPIYSGLVPEQPSDAYSVLVSSTSPPGLPNFAPHHDRPVAPGETDRFTVTLRFAPSGSPITQVGSTAYRSWSKTWPAKLRWNDRRVIGTAYVASSPAGNPKKANGYPNNPRRYFNDAKADTLDVNSPVGIRKFQRRVLDYAASIASNLRKLDAQGVITWDLEGEEYPQETSYVCSPDLIASVAPEMESVIRDQGSKYAGMKLDDAYFKTIRDAGFRVGVCVRPQHFSQGADGTAQQRYLPSNEVEAELARKMKYAHDRWGATLFYLDSTVSENGAVLDASIIEAAAAAVPDSLIIPEESNTRYYAYAAPFHDFLFHGRGATEPGARAAYSKAFSAVLVNDVDSKKLEAAKPSLTDAVAHGDVLMVHADYWHPNNATAVEIYKAADRASRRTTP